MSTSMATNDSSFGFLSHAQATAFIFPGQGSQHVGMGQALLEVYPAARAAMDEADQVLGFDLTGLCLAGPEDQLTDTINAQPALLAVSVATLRAVAEELGVESLTGGGSAVFVAGHSMGEYSALVAAGALAFADGLRLVRERGRLMKEAGTRSPGMMAAILGLDEEKVAAICAEITDAGSGIAQVANDNCPGQVVISGDRPGMEQAMEALQASGARKVVPLAVSIAAHSPLMAPAAEELRAAIDATPLQTPSLPVIANTSAQPLYDVDAIRAELTAQLTGSVRWTDSMRLALSQGVTRFVEIGPGEVLTGLAKRIDRKAQRQAVNDPDGVRNLVASLRAE